MKQKGSLSSLVYLLMLDYLFMTYIVTSKPKRISVAAGVVHMIISFKLLTIRTISNYKWYVTPLPKLLSIVHHEQ